MTCRDIEKVITTQFDTVFHKNETFQHKQCFIPMFIMQSNGDVLWPCIGHRQVFYVPQNMFKKFIVSKI